jgi:osmotically-inducible protein OsmY
MVSFRSSLLTIAAAFTLSGCLAAAAGAGAEAGYVATREDNRTTAQTIDDQAIVASVKTKYLADQQVSGLNINIDSFKGNVTLRGFVRSAAEADKAIRIAQNTGGVQSVNSKLTIQ